MNTELFNFLCRVYMHFYKIRWHSVLKASDYRLPWFIERAKKKEEFTLEYRGMSLASFIEAIRNNTTELEGAPNKELMDALTQKFSGGIENTIFKVYWEEIIKEVKATKSDDTRPIVSGVSKLFMYRLFGPNSIEPNPDILNSITHDMAISFQIGCLMSEYYHSVRKVLQRFAKQEQK